MLVLKMAILVGALMVPPVRSFYPPPPMKQLLSEAEILQQAYTRDLEAYAYEKIWISNHMDNFLKNHRFLNDIYKLARCCQLLHEWDPVVGISFNYTYGPFSVGTTWPWKVLWEKIPYDISVWMLRIEQTHVSWEHLLIMFIGFWESGSKPESWHTRVIKFIACTWEKMDGLTHDNSYLYDFYHSTSRYRLGLNSKGFAAELKIMEHAVFCYQINGYKKNEKFSWSETTWEDIRNAIHCFKREVMAAGDHLIMIEVYSTFLDELKPFVALAEIGWTVIFHKLSPWWWCYEHTDCWDYYMFNGKACPSLVPYRPQSIPFWFTMIRDGVAKFVDDKVFNGTFGKVLYRVNEKWDDVKSDILNGKRRIVQKDGYSVVDNVL